MACDDDGDDVGSATTPTTPPPSDELLLRSERDAYDRLVQDGGRPVYDWVAFVRVRGAPGGSPHLIGPFWDYPEPYGHETRTELRQVFQRQYTRWCDFRAWQRDHRDLPEPAAPGNARPADADPSQHDKREWQRHFCREVPRGSSFHDYEAAVRRRVADHVTAPFALHENPAQQSEAATWIECLAFELWWLKWYVTRLPDASSNPGRRTRRQLRDAGDTAPRRSAAAGTREHLVAEDMWQRQEEEARAAVVAPTGNERKGVETRRQRQTREREAAALEEARLALLDRTVAPRPSGHPSFTTPGPHSARAWFMHCGEMQADLVAWVKTQLSKLLTPQSPQLGESSGSAAARRSRSVDEDEPPPRARKRQADGSRHPTGTVLTDTAAARGARAARPLSRSTRSRSASDEAAPTRGSDRARTSPRVETSGAGAAGAARNVQAPRARARQSRSVAPQTGSARAVQATKMAAAAVAVLDRQAAVPRRSWRDVVGIPR